MGNISVVLALGSLIGVPLFFGVTTTLGYISKAPAWDACAMVFWTSFYMTVGSVIALFILGEQLKVMHYQRQTSEPVAVALYSIYCHEDSTTGRKVLTILVCFIYHIFLTSMASAVGAQLAKRYLAGA